MSLNKLVLLLAVSLTYYSGTGQGHTIRFQVDGLSDSTITVGYFMGPKKYVHDTLRVEKGSFIIQGKDQLNAGLYFAYTPSFYFEFIVKDQVFSINTSTINSYQNAKIEGSPENEIFREFQVKMAALRPEEIEIQEALKKASGKDSVQLQHVLREKINAIQTFREELINQDPNTFMASFLRLMEEVEVLEFEEITDPQERKIQQYRHYKQHYFDQVALDDPALLRTPLLHQKVMKYFDQVISKHPDSINVAIDQLFEAIGDNQELYRYWLISIYQNYQESNIMGMDKVTVHLMEDYLLSDRADWLDESARKKIKEEVAFTKPNLIGNMAPRLELVDTLMQPFYFDQIQDPFLLLYFFDPDCGHCRKKTPVLVEHYPELKSLGVEVVAICTTTDVERWKEYTQETNMEFYSLADPGYESNFRVNYNLRSTPKIYLLDQQRKIIAKQLEIEDIVHFVKRYSQ